MTMQKSNSLYLVDYAAESLPVEEKHCRDFRVAAKSDELDDQIHGVIQECFWEGPKAEGYYPIYVLQDGTVHTDWKPVRCWNDSLSIYDGSLVIYTILIPRNYWWQPIAIKRWSDIEREVIKKWPDADRPDIDTTVIETLIVEFTREVFSLSNVIKS